MPDKTTTIPLLRTKLHRPPAPGDHVHRARLLERLEKRRQRPLTLVSAPAGYGKSTLVSCWLDRCNSPGGWLSLDEYDNDLRLFLTYFAAAVQIIFPDAVSETMTLSNARTMPPVSVLAGSMANELDLIEQDFILVLDDIHRIQAQSVHELLTELLRHPPRPMHLVLVGRRDPNLPITALRARNQVTEVRLFDLRFTTVETAEFLETALGAQVDEARAAAIAEKAEGWVTGLRLAVLAMRGHENAVSELLKLKGTTAYVMDYLINEVLDAQSPVIRHYLLSTSILDRFCAPLCDLLCGPAVEPGEGEIDGDEFIARLQKDNLFQIALDTENRWFRYHHLFQDLLLSQLKRRYSSEEIATLHSRASEWFAENGLIDEALQHAIAANDLPYAVKLIQQHRYDLMNREEWNRLERWLKMLPPETVETTPTLLSAQAFLSEHRGQIFEAFGYRDQAERLLHALPPESPEGKAVRGAIMVLHSMQHIVSGDGDRAIESAEQAITLLPAEALHIWSYAIGEQVLANQMAGDIGAGLKLINEMLSEHTLLPAITQARMMLWFCMAYWMESDLTVLKQPALQCLKIGEQHALLESIRFARYFLGALHYVRNELAEAERYLVAVVADPYKVRPTYFAQASFALALIYARQGGDRDAANLVESVISHSVENNHMTTAALAHTFKVELTLQQENVAEALRLSEGVDFDIYPPVWFLYVPQLTPIKALLAQNTPQSLEKALIQSDQLDAFLRKANRRTIRIDLLALQALTLDAQSQESAAFEKLGESLALAEPGGFTRNFVNLGPPMADLLKRLKKQNVDVDYIEKILAAFTDDERAVVQDVSGPEAGPTLSVSPQPLEDPLTNRELDVLELLARRLQNKEIADKLFVSIETVKTHLNNIYQKLQVSNRREAVERAKKIGIL